MGQAFSALYNPADYVTVYWLLHHRRAIQRPSNSDSAARGQKEHLAKAATLCIGREGPALLLVEFEESAVRYLHNHVRSGGRMPEA